MLAGKDLEDLWFDDGFDGAIMRIAQKYDLPPDELKQEVFLEITEHDSLSTTACRRAIWRAAQKIWRDKIREDKSISQDELNELGQEAACTNEYDEQFTDASRLSPQDQMVSDFIGIFQPTATRDIHKGRLLVNGTRI